MIRLKQIQREDCAGFTSIECDKDLFSTARSIFDKQPDERLLCYFGDAAFQLVHEADYLQYGAGQKKSLPVNTNYPGGSLSGRVFELDLTLLARYEGYCFYELEEYTWAVADLILYLWPQKKVWFRDPKAAFIFKEKVHLLTNEKETDWLIKNQKTLSVLSDGVHRNIPRGGSNSYQSIQIMYSLCWIRNHRSLGHRNDQETVFVMDLRSKYGGLGDIVKSVHGYCQVARKRGWIPVANVYDTQYSDNEAQNIWNEYFKPVSVVSLNQALESKDVILGRDNGMSDLPCGLEYACNPYFEECYLAEDVPLVLQPELEKYFESIADPRLSSGETLGVLARGSDLAVCMEYKCDWPEIAERVKRIKERNGFQTVFLATEESDCLQVFQKKFPGQLLYVDQSRISANDLKGKHPISELLRKPIGERTQWGKTYLYIVWCLSKCRELLYTYPAGAYVMAKRMRLARNETAPFTLRLTEDSKDYYKESLLKELQDLEMVLVYGAGHNARILQHLLSGDKCELVFFDRRAEYEPMNICGRTVLPPEKITEYLDYPVVISPYLGQKEIADDLIKKGVAVERLRFSGL